MPLPSFFCCFSKQDEYANLDEKAGFNPQIDTSTEVTDLLETNNGQLALKLNFFTKEQAEIVGSDMLEEVLLSENGLKAMQEKVITIDQVITLMDELKKKMIPAVNVVQYLVSDDGRARLKSGELTFETIPEEKEFTDLAIVLSPLNKEAESSANKLKR
jgi:hypothetical protein